MDKNYVVNEIFYTLQGEGGRAGQASVFVRFAGCNLSCNEEEHGFDCDTEFSSGIRMTLDGLVQAICDEVGEWGPTNVGYDKWVVFTGGEPTLQIDDDLIVALKVEGWKLAIETNGTHGLLTGFDWVCVSPKTAEHTLKAHKPFKLFAAPTINEVKYVRNVGQGIPRPAIQANLQWLSPAFTPDGKVDRDALKHCVELCLDNPAWRLSCQQHKWWGVR